jgi:hypothetical protein
MLDGSVTPVGPHRDDILIASDGTSMRREVAFTDCRDGAHSDEDACREANNEIVAELVDRLCVDAGEYTENEDYGSGYACVVNERRDNWNDLVKDWLDEAYNDGKGYCPSPTFVGIVQKALVASIGHLIHDCNDFEARHHPSEYASYSGNGCCIDSFEVGECEEQVDITCFDEFVALDESGDLEGCLDEYDGDAYLYCNDHYDSEAKRRVRTGYVSSGCFTFYHSPGGQWQFIVSADDMKEYLCSAIIEYCERADG